MPLTIETAARKDRVQPTAANFQHRHFAEIAAIIRAIPRDPDGHYYNRAAMAEHFADRLAWSNPRFDRARFLRACTD